MEKIYIAIADDHQIIRDGLSMIFNNMPQYELLHAAKDGEELIQLINEHKTLPDIILMDIDMPNKNGLDVCEEINDKFPEVAVIFLTNHISRKYIETAILAGGQGYLAKDSDVDTIKLAIDEVFENGFYYNEYWSIDLIKSLMDKGKVKHTFGDNIVLTDREMDVLLRICEEKTDTQIAEELLISKLTVESYRKSLIKKIGVKKSIGLAIFAIRENLI